MSTFEARIAYSIPASSSAMMASGRTAPSLMSKTTVSDASGSGESALAEPTSVSGVPHSGHSVRYHLRGARQEGHHRSRSLVPSGASAMTLRVQFHGRAVREHFGDAGRELGRV